MDAVAAAAATAAVASRWCDIGRRACMWEYVITVTPRQRDVARIVFEAAAAATAAERKKRAAAEGNVEGGRPGGKAGGRRGGTMTSGLRVRAGVCVCLINQTLAFGILAREKEEELEIAEERIWVGKRGKGKVAGMRKGEGEERRRGRGGGAVGQAGSRARGRAGPSQTGQSRAALSQALNFASLAFSFLSPPSYPTVSLFPLDNSFFLTLSFAFAQPLFPNPSTSPRSALFSAWLPCIGESTTHQLADRRPLKAQSH